VEQMNEDKGIEKIEDTHTVKDKAKEKIEDDNTQTFTIQMKTESENISHYSTQSQHDSRDENPYSLSDYELLVSVDPQMAERIHPNDKRKIKRYLELYQTQNILPSEVFFLLFFCF
jgi:tRNA A37 N6-isopentenylltransferase MiaA